MIMNKIDLYDSKTCTLIGLVVNLFLTIFKLLAGVFGISYAMLADGIHSASDTFATGAAYFGIRLGEKPADEEHPYGHANAETIVAFIVGIIILGTGIFIGASAIHLILEGDYEAPATIAMVAAVLSIVIKEAMFRYTIRVGNRNNSPAVIASAWDHRSDAFSSIAALVGIVGAKVSFEYLDPIAGVLISLLIIWMSFKLIRSNIGIMMYERPEPEFLEVVKNTACVIDGVEGVDEVRVHRCGPDFNVDLKIAVNENLTVGEGHQIAGKVRAELLINMRHVRDVMVHVNPAEIEVEIDEDSPNNED